MLALLALHGAGVPISEMLMNMLRPAVEDDREESDAWKATTAAAAACSAPELIVGAPERCATELGVVAFTAISSSVELTRAIAKAERRPQGVPCLAVGLTRLAMRPPQNQHREPFPLSVEPLWINSAACWSPPATWCNFAAGKLMQVLGPSGSGGWRHAQIVKTQGLLLLLQRGLHVLIQDLEWDWPSAGMNSAMSRLLRCQMDFVGYSDEMPFPGLNVSLLLVRGSANSLRVAERTANRSYALPDQLVFNEELSAAAAALRASCCTLGERPDAEDDPGASVLFLPGNNDAAPFEVSSSSSGSSSSDLLEKCARPGDESATSLLVTLEAPTLDDTEGSSACEPCDCAGSSGRAMETLVQGGGYTSEQASAKLLSLGVDVELQ